MDLLPNSDEQQIIDTAAAFLTRTLPIHRLHADDDGRFSAAIRAEIAELGWFGLGIAEEAGGYGFTAVDETLLFRELGRYIGPVAVLGISLAAKTAAAAGKSDLVARLMAGEVTVAIVASAPEGGPARLLEYEGAAYALNLTGGTAYLLDLAKVEITAVPCLDKSVSMGLADLSAAPVVARAPAGPVQRAARLATAAMLVGSAEAVTDMIVEYAKIRETFGRPIGAYQAVRHPCADMAVRAFTARAQLFLAAVSVRDDLPDAELQLDAAAILAGEAAVMNADANIQMHGGIGTTSEHNAHFFMKRAHLLRRLFGTGGAIDRIIGKTGVN